VLAGRVLLHPLGKPRQAFAAAFGVEIVPGVNPN
jgi:hypothetical protein